MVINAKASIVEKFSHSPENSPQPEIKAFLAAPAADDGPCVVDPSPSKGAIMLPGAIPDSSDDVSAFVASPSPRPAAGPPAAANAPKTEPRSHAPLKSRPDSASGRPASAERSRPEGEATAGSKRPGSAGRNREEKIKPSVWLTDKRKVAVSDHLKSAEKNIDKDIFRKKSPMKKGPRLGKESSAKEDPGPQRPTTAKSRNNRPSSAEKNRSEVMKPSVWLGDIARDSKTGQRSFIECKSASDRPSSAEGKRKNKGKKSKQNKGDSNRPGSAERNRDDKVNNKLWLEGPSRPHDGDQNRRPGSAGRGRSQQLDQNGRTGLAPLKGLKGGSVEV